MYDYRSSNAKKLDYVETEYRKSAGKTVSLNNTEAEKKQKNIKVNEKQVVSAVRLMFTVAVAFLLAFFVVRGQIAIDEADEYISELNTNLRNVQAENQTIKAQIDKSVDLKNLQVIANEKFGMVRPENYQIFYVNINKGDYSENINDIKSDKIKKDIPVEGLTGVLISSADMFK